jgi:hypothetical protein
VISPLLSNIYLTELDQMLERAKATTRNGKYTYVEYARFADDLVVLIVTPSIPGAPLFILAISYASRRCFHLADVDVQTPETPGRFSLRLDDSPFLRSCKLTDVFVISSLPPM